MNLRVDLPYLVRDTDRHGNVRLYVRRNGRKIRIRAELGTETFARLYAGAVEALDRPAEARQQRSPSRWPAGSFGWLAQRYFVADEFLSLDPESQKTRRRVIESCLKEPHSVEDADPLGNCPLAFISSKKIKRLRDLKAGKPGAANNRRKYLSAMFGWAIETDLMKSNPARDVRRKKYATNGFYTWTLSDLTAFENRHPVGSKARLALALMLYLGVRRGDLVRLGTGNIRERRQSDGAITRSIVFVPNKTRYKRLIESEKPLLPALAMLVEASPCGTRTFLETEYGLPFTDKGFGNWFRDRCDEAGLTKCSAHGLRKIGATLCAENGATEHQLMALFDWSTPAQAAIYTRAASRRRLAAAGMNLMQADARVH